MTTDKTARWLDLLAFLLQYRWGATREQIFANVRGYDGKPESARRTFERDKDELRGAGIDIETVPLDHAEGDEAATGYRLRAPGFYLPYFELTQSGSNEPRPYPGLRRVSLSETELKALDRATRRLVELEDSPFAAAASAARRKLAFDLPLDADSVGTVIAPPLPQHGSESLAVLQEAVATHTAVNCRYYAISRDVEDERVIEPYGIYFQWGHWYCVARARDRNAIRVFRADRMRSASLLKNDTFTVPGDFDIRRYLGRAPWEMGEGPSMPARVHFAFPVSQWVANQRAGRAVEPASEDGSAVLEFDVRDRAAFLRWLLSFRRDASLIEPAPLAQELAELRARVAALYADDEGLEA